MKLDFKKTLIEEILRDKRNVLDEEYLKRQTTFVLQEILEDLNWQLREDI